MTRAKFLGTSDEVNTCDCCGRKGLKSTVALELDDASDPVYYGVSCAAQALRLSAKEVRAHAKAVDDANETERRRLEDIERRKQDALWQAYLDERVPELRGERFQQIQALGGYSKAKAGFR